MKALRIGRVSDETGGRPGNRACLSGRPATVCVTLLDPLGFGGRGESPWLWLVIVGGGIGLYVCARVRGWPPVRRWSDVGDRLLLVGAPWWQQALFCAIVGSGSLYHLASGHYRWYWWFLPAVAWLAFAEVVVRRRGAGGK